MSEWKNVKDKWKKLWAFYDAGNVNPFELKTCFPDWMKKVRAEGELMNSNLKAIEIILGKHPRQTTYHQISRVVEDYSILMVDIEKILKGEIA